MGVTMQLREREEEKEVSGGRVIDEMSIGQNIESRGTACVLMASQSCCLFTYSLSTISQVTIPVARPITKNITKNMTVQ